MQIDPAIIKKILVINLAFIGDTILATPAVRALRRAFPGAAIHMLVVPWAADAARGNPFADEVILYDKRGEHKNIFRLWALISRLRREKYDLAAAMNFAPRGAFVAWAAGVKYRLGWDAQHAALFLTHVASAKRDRVRHETETYLNLLKPLGITADDAALDFRLDPQAVAGLEGKLKIEKKDRPLVLVCPFGRHPLKSWTISGYIELVRYVATVADCILVGGRTEEQGLAEINAGAGNVATALAGVLSIGELAALIAKADLLITVDTGPLHIAGAVGTPVLAIFGPTDYRGWGPRGPRDVIVHNRTECWPCGRRECGHHRCMTGLAAGEVIRAAADLLAAIKERRGGILG